MTHTYKNKSIERVSKAICRNHVCNCLQDVEIFDNAKRSKNGHFGFFLLHKSKNPNSFWAVHDAFMLQGNFIMHYFGGFQDRLVPLSHINIDQFPVNKLINSDFRLRKQNTVGVCKTNIA